MPTDGRIDAGLPTPCSDRRAPPTLSVYIQVHLRPKHLAARAALPTAGPNTNGAGACRSRPSAPGASPSRPDSAPSRSPARRSRCTPSRALATRGSAAAMRRRRRPPGRDTWQANPDPQPVRRLLALAARSQRLALVSDRKTVPSAGARRLADRDQRRRGSAERQHAPWLTAQSAPGVRPFSRPPQLAAQPPARASRTSSARTPSGAMTGADHGMRTTRSPCARSQPSTSTATIRHSPDSPAMRAIASG